jgi:hypothetical protein
MAALYTFKQCAACFYDNRIPKAVAPLISDMKHTSVKTFI